MKINTKVLSVPALRHISSTLHPAYSRLRPVYIVALVSLLAACSGGSGQSNTENVNTDVGNQSPELYTGPAPQTEDIQNFKLNIWDNLVGEDRCGACHVEGGQSPQFVRGDDINLAYNEVSSIVNLSDPQSSEMVQRVGTGHNCWLEVSSVCGDIITDYIAAWAGESGGEQNTVVLTAPEIRDVGVSKTFPESSDGYDALHTIFTTYCSNCHTEDSAVRQQPYFASSDIDVSYEWAKPRIDLATPANSRFVQKIGGESHNCWTSCSANADEVQQAIADFADGIEATVVDPDLTISKALNLADDGIVASSGGRIEDNLIALFEFKAGTGSTAFDTSGVEPAMNLNIIGDVDWLGSWGLRIRDGKAQASTATSRKMYDLITATGEYSIEAWVVPDNVTQDGPARIISYSGGADIRNFTLGQTLYNYNFLNRTSGSDGNGMPALSTADADERLQATLQHVAITYDAINGRRIYVNGEFTGDVDGETGESLSTWDDSFAFVLGQEVSGQDQWQGSVRLLAVYNRALEEDVIVNNFEAGVGEKFFLLFSVSHLIDVADAYVVFEVQQFDDYSYLFNAPFFTSLDGTASFSGIPVNGIRIGVNGQEAAAGQAYANIDTSLDSSLIVEGRQALSRLGTVIALDQGPEFDQFFLTFDRIGDETSVRVTALPPVGAEPVDIEDQPTIGVRRFEEINFTLSSITGISTANAAVAETFDKVRQQLPIVEAIDGFLAAHQMGVTQLAVEYCSELVGELGDSDTSARDAMFSGLNFSATPDVAYDLAGRNALISPLLDVMVAGSLPEDAPDYGSEVPLEDQPDAGVIETELNNLVDAMMTSCPGTCAAEPDRTLKIAKAVCAAATGSAVMLLQ